MHDASREQNIVAIVKTKVQEKNDLEMNGFTENECLPNLELKFKILENLRKPLTLKSRGRRIDIDAENCTNIRAKLFVILYENCSTNCKQLLDEIFVISRIIKVEVWVISRS